MPDSSVRLAQRGAGQRGVLGLAVAAGLEPQLQLGVQGQQHPLPRRVDHQGAGGDVPGLAGLPHAVRVRGQVVQIRPAQLVLAGVGRGPALEDAAPRPSCRLTSSPSLVAAVAGVLAGSSPCRAAAPRPSPSVPAASVAACSVGAGLARGLAEHLVQLGEVERLAVDEAVRVVQVGRGRQHVRVRPQPVAAVDPAGVGERGPQPGGVPQPARAAAQGRSGWRRSARPGRRSPGAGAASRAARPRTAGAGPRPRARPRPPSPRPARAPSPAGPAPPSAPGCPPAGTCPAAAPPGAARAATGRAGRRPPPAGRCPP